jgi:uncharacterized protein (TIGR02145 family)
MQLKIETFNKEQLLKLNEQIQALPMDKRKSYLESLGAFGEDLHASEDYLVDERDYNIYSIVRIGDQEWLGENLRYKGGIYTENSDNPNLFYGCLYDWAAMMGLDDEYNYVECSGWSNNHFIAPKGWSIPSDKDWKELKSTLSLSKSASNDTILPENLGDEIKSSHGWNEEGNGNDRSGFTALPAGYESVGLGKYAYFWSSTFLKYEENPERATLEPFLQEIPEARAAVCYSFEYDEGYMTRGGNFMTSHYSCRCIKNK